MADITELAVALWEKVEVVGPIRDGDTVLVRLAEGLTRRVFDDQASQIAEAIRESLPNVAVVFLANVEQVLVYRPGS